MTFQSHVIQSDAYITDLLSLEITAVDCDNYEGQIDRNQFYTHKQSFLTRMLLDSSLDDLSDVFESGWTLYISPTFKFSYVSRPLKVLN